VTKEDARKGMAKDINIEIPPNPAMRLATTRTE